MTMTDPIADMLTRTRNAHKISASSVSIPHSKIKESIASVLLEEGYIKGFSSEESENNKSNLNIELKYFDCKPHYHVVDINHTQPRAVRSCLDYANSHSAPRHTSVG